jgi:hypothetical protein
MDCFAQLYARFLASFTLGIAENVRRYPGVTQAAQSRLAHELRALRRVYPPGKRTHTVINQAVRSWKVFRNP